jgi:uncharacterized lipoprotein YddW (UPF0748 family)
MNLFRPVLLLLIAWILSSAQAGSYQDSTLVPPGVNREFRGAWIATVDNAVWPSQPGLTAAQQKRELTNLFDQAVRLKLNAVIFQVRPACDAFYKSRLEPWSEYLTGTMGKSPGYDPLEFAVREAHRRGLELHAWFNPFRARASTRSPASADHISRSKPDLVQAYHRQLWLDPGEPEARAYSLEVILDVARRYDIDAIHLDDYFYPYPEKNTAGREIPFPDDASWRHYGVKSGLGRNDWRRENINIFIRQLSQSIRLLENKSALRLGISPFGIWRPGNPPQIKGLDAWDELFADSRKWLSNGWLDYCAPQLYWAVNNTNQSFPVLLKWWSEQNTRHRHLWAGLNSLNVGGEWQSGEILEQIRLTRRQPGVTGQIHWSMKALASGALPSSLSKTLYAEPALVPVTTWLPASPGLSKPGLKASGTRSITATWKANGRARVWLWLLQTRSSGKWSTQILPGETTSLAFTNSRPEYIAITAVDRLGNTSRSAVLQYQ